MWSETICKSIGFIAIVLIGISLIRVVMNYQANIVEGLTNKSSSSSSSKKLFKNIESIGEYIEKDISKKKSILQIDSERRNHYEDMIQNLDTIIGAEILIQITENAKMISKKPGDKKTLQLMEQLNTMSAFKDTLNKNQTEWLDTKGDFI